MTLGLALVGVLDQVRGGWVHELSPINCPCPCPIWSLIWLIPASSCCAVGGFLFQAIWMDGLDWLAG